MTDEPISYKAYEDEKFMNGPDARGVRILTEYLEPESRLAQFAVSDTIVFFGSARLLPRDVAKTRLDEAVAENGDVKSAERNLMMSRFYEDARELANRLTVWSKGLEDAKRRFLICTGGGPGIMEAANRGASEAGGVNIGFNISLPFEQHFNPYITRELNFEFHYFFMRKFWFLYLAKALVVFPGGFGTMDELFEAMTLMQTQKTKKRMPIVLFGREFWGDVLNLEALVKYGTISEKDLDLFHITDSVEDAYDHLVERLTKNALSRPGGYI
ncbi:MAG: TIGR00730 family Rossman fold protein [Rhodospirillales bacterium]|nr:TIGR00730 family Rossman fold protein [Rhodospirillales bacterium]